MTDQIRYAVVGLGHIAQVAVLPAFEHTERAELSALVSDDKTKLSELGDKYGIKQRLGYDEYDQLMRSGEVDAVYIALPNHLHCDYTERAAQAGVHVLCEKPMAVTEAECVRMIDACEDNGVKLMVAYRLHWEAANMAAVDLAQSGKLGDVRLFNSTFTMDVKEGDIRLDPDKGGGTLYDIGVYCINAARYLFRAEPMEVLASSESRPEKRFEGVDEMSSVILRFPDHRMAAFTTSFGSSSVGDYRLVGTKGDVRLDPAYTYAGSINMTVTSEDGTEEQTFEKRDQFAALLDRFARCIEEDLDPEAGGHEGLADVRIVEAAYRSAREQRPIALGDFPRQKRPDGSQTIERPPVESKPKEVHASGPRR